MLRLHPTPPERSRPVIDCTLKIGKHQQREMGMCAMEFAAYIAGEEHTDFPLCVPLELAKLFRQVNDRLGDEKRQLLKPYVIRATEIALKDHNLINYRVYAWRYDHPRIEHLFGTLPHLGRVGLMTHYFPEVLAFFDEILPKVEVAFGTTIVRPELDPDPVAA